jgi:hypothetical protein
MFEYLKRYCGNFKHPSNSFYPVEAEEIERLEKFLGYKIPSQLRQFYHEIGYGSLTHPKEFPKDYVFYNANAVHSPSLILEMLEKGQESGYISEDVYEDLKPGDIPFFEIGDSSSFMIMKALSDNPNAIWYMGMEKIEDSLEQFIHNLYYISPAYYADNW